MELYGIYVRGYEDRGPYDFEIDQDIATPLACLTPGKGVKFVTYNFRCSEDSIISPK